MDSAVSRQSSKHKEVNPVACSDIDRNLLNRCLANKPRAWADFADRFLGLVVHVANHTAQSKSTRLSEDDRAALLSEVFGTLRDNDCQLLRHFRGNSSLATYLTVVSRRIAVKSLSRHKSPSRLGDGSIHSKSTRPSIDRSDSTDSQFSTSAKDHVESLLGKLEDLEARARHLTEEQNFSREKRTEDLDAPKSSSRTASKHAPRSS